MSTARRWSGIRLFLPMLLCLAWQTTGRGEEMYENESASNHAYMLEYYTRQGMMTDPGEFAYLYEEVPADVGQICKAVQGVMLHVFWARGYGVELSQERQQEVNIRKVEDMLKRLVESDSQPVCVARTPNSKVVGNCRDFSLLLCSLLRHKNIPARPRCGFATYFTPGKYEDHWICEYWNADMRRWVRVDAQLDSLQMAVLKIDFDPLDLPPGKFLAAGETWQLCRSGDIDPDRCGIFDLKGLWFVAGNVMRDFMALNKVEVLPWDCNKIMETQGDQLTDEDLTLLDEVSSLTVADSTVFGEIRSLYNSNAALRMPDDWEP